MRTPTWFKGSPAHHLWQAARRRFAKPQTRNAWSGSVVNRLNDFVFSTIQSANQELRYELTLLRARARELARNNPTARRFLKLLEQNVVGHKGIRLEAQITLKTGSNAGQPHEDVNDLIETAWQDWGRKGQCDVTRKHSWVSFQQLCIKTVARDGEAFVRIVEGFDNDYGFALQLLDADQFDETHNVPGTNGDPRWVMGVRQDQYGAATGYMMWTTHPQEAPSGQRKKEPISAKNILHLYLEERAGQARGVPWFAPITVAMRMLDGYTEAELVAARTSAAKMGFIQQGEDAEGPDPDQPPGTTQTMEAAPGVIDRLGKGETFQSWDPEHPAGNFEPFVLAIQRLMAMGLNVSAVSLTGNLKEANYSSMRVGLLDERDGWRSLQTWFTDNLSDPVYRRWLRVASLTEKLRLPSYDYAKYEQVVWRPRGWAWVDPKNDIESSAIAVKEGFTSRTCIVAEQGYEHADVLKEIAAENAEAQKLGVELVQINAPLPPPPVKPEPVPVDEQAAADRQAMLAVARSIDGNTKWAAQKDPAPPVINVKVEPTTVHAPITVEQPAIHVDARTTIEPAQVHVAAAEPAHVTVTTPDIKVEPTINVAAAEAPVVNMAPITVKLETPKGQTKRSVQIKNARGKVLRTAELTEESE